MGYKIPLPPVKNTIKAGNFTFYIYAYRRLTKTECKFAISKYMTDSHMKKIPVSGSVKIITQFGSNPVDSL